MKKELFSLSSTFSSREAIIPDPSGQHLYLTMAGRGVEEWNKA